MGKGKTLTVPAGRPAEVARWMRQSAGMMQPELAALCGGVTQGCISQIESGKFAVSLRMLDTIARECGCHLSLTAAEKE